MVLHIIYSPLDMLGLPRAHALTRSSTQGSTGHNLEVGWTTLALPHTGLARNDWLYTVSTRPFVLLEQMRRMHGCPARRGGPEVPSSRVGADLDRILMKLGNDRSLLADDFTSN